MCRKYVLLIALGLACWCAGAAAAARVDGGLFGRHALTGEGASVAALRQQQHAKDKNLRLPEPDAFGFLDVNPSKGSKMFYMYFEAQEKNLSDDGDTPIVLWLQVSLPQRRGREKVYQSLGSAVNKGRFAKRVVTLGDNGAHAAATITGRRCTARPADAHLFEIPLSSRPLGFQETTCRPRPPPRASTPCIRVQFRISLLILTL